MNDQRGKCPICGKPAAQPRPFCSRRCADIDLGRWFSGQYAVPVTEEEPADESDAQPGLDRGGVSG